MEVDKLSGPVCGAEVESIPSEVIRMRGSGWLLAALLGWTAIGGLGTLLALATGDRRRAIRGAGWIVGVWAVYMAVLLGVNARQSQRVVAAGQEECFETVCFAVVEVRTQGEFKGEGGGRLVQVGIRARNRGTETAGVEGLSGYLVDADGRQWSQTRGVGGVSLTVRLPSGGEALSEPVFRVPRGSGNLSLVLTRGRTGWGWLQIGDTDAIGHRKTILRLEEGDR